MQRPHVDLNVSVVCIQYWVNSTCLYYSFGHIKYESIERTHEKTFDIIIRKLNENTMSNIFATRFWCEDTQVTCFISAPFIRMSSLVPFQKCIFGYSESHRCITGFDFILAIIASHSWSFMLHNEKLLPGRWSDGLSTMYNDVVCCSATTHDNAPTVFW
jgi:hypothetical protein